MSDSNASASADVLVELCVDAVRSVEIAARCGVDRVELNAGYEVGGLTPSLGTMIGARVMAAIPIIAMLRPRPGGFCYDDSEVRVMHRDAELLLQHGANGLAFGFLKEDRTIDEPRCKELIRRCGGTTMVFHRAFDEVPDPLTAIEKLIDLGVHRILTSGQQPTAREGAGLIAKLIRAAAGRIEILPAAGIRSGNVGELIDITRCSQVHASLLKAKSTSAGHHPLDEATAREFIRTVRMK